jgi:hypothetical protein
VGEEINNHCYRRGGFIPPFWQTIYSNTVIITTNNNNIVIARHEAIFYGTARVPLHKPKELLPVIQSEAKNPS